MDLDVLGPLVVRAGGRQLRLGPALRVLLLCLLCAGGDLVPAGKLAAMSAGNGSSEVSPATLRSHVAHLRRAVNDVTGLARDERESVIVTGHVGRGTAYGLRLEALTVDASRFVREAALGMGELRSGDAERAAVTLRAALGLWRGEPLADVRGHPFAQAEIRRLEAVYRAALVARVRADAWCGLGLSSASCSPWSSGGLTMRNCGCCWSPACTAAGARLRPLAPAGRRSSSRWSTGLSRGAWPPCRWTC